VLMTETHEMREGYRVLAIERLRKAPSKAKK
jgi:hypothetical protein